MAVLHQTDKYLRNLALVKVSSYWFGGRGQSECTYLLIDNVYAIVAYIRLATINSGHYVVGVHVKKLCH